jgi:CheY-like chemotaxis protein
LVFARTSQAQLGATAAQRTPRLINPLTEGTLRRARKVLATPVLDSRGWRISLGKGNALLLANTDSERTENVSTGSFANRSGEKDKRTRRVLLVNDHALFREVLALVLERHADLDNIQTGSVGEARQVLSSTTSNDFALAVVDLDLPDEGGFELIGQLRRVGIPVLALTTNRDPERSARVSGSGEVLSTAVSCDEMLDATRRLVGG